MMKQVQMHIKYLYDKLIFIIFNLYTIQYLVCPALVLEVKYLTWATCNLKCGNNKINKNALNRKICLLIKSTSPCFSSAC